MPTMTPEEERMAHVRKLADSRCKNKHPSVYDSLIAVGSASEKSFGPPCDECLRKTEGELVEKKLEAHGRLVSPEDHRALIRKLKLEI